MKARLMFAERDLSSAREPRVGEADLVDDLELETLWGAMAQGDPVILDSARAAILDVLVDPDLIRYRQAVLADCLANPDAVRRIYALAVKAVADEKQVHRSWWSKHGESVVRRAVTVLELFVGALEELRAMADEDSAGFVSEGFQRFFETLRHELDEAYFEQMAEHLRRLRFRGGVLATARLGKQGQGVEYVLRAPRRHLRIWRFGGASVPRPSFSYTVPPRDEGGGQAMEALRDRILGLVGDAVGQSTDHITSFFVALRAELAFYIGCLNLHEVLAAKGEPLSMPDPHPHGTATRNARGLYDPCLSLRVEGRVQGNALEADGKPLIMITGANQGGKSTFLRSLGLAQLMMQAGMFVAAESFAATVAGGVFTHYKRGEDVTMTAGKFDEELARMSALAPSIADGDLLLCNESFAATNEREGSEIAGEVIRAMTDGGTSVAFVTHLYELAHRFEREGSAMTLFLRAGRDGEGRRSFRLSEAGPLPTSYGEDVYREVFTTPNETRRSSASDARRVQAR